VAAALIAKRAKHAMNVSQKARHIARLARVLRETKSVSLRMTNKSLQFAAEHGDYVVGGDYAS
jgi:hypothetical protein